MGLSGHGLAGWTRFLVRLDWARFGLSATGKGYKSVSPFFVHLPASIFLAELDYANFKLSDRICRRRESYHSLRRPGRCGMRGLWNLDLL